MSPNSSRSGTTRWFLLSSRILAVCWSRRTKLSEAQRQKGPSCTTLQPQHSTPCRRLRPMARKHTHPVSLCCRCWWSSRTEATITPQQSLQTLWERSPGPGLQTSSTCALWLGLTAPPQGCVQRLERWNMLRWRSTWYFHQHDFCRECIYSKHVTYIAGSDKPDLIQLLASTQLNAYVSAAHTFNGLALV